MSQKIRTSTESAQLIAAYFRENGSMPTQNTPPSGEQKRLAEALHVLRKLKLHGKLPAAAGRILDVANPAWTVRANSADRLWQARADEVVEWVNRYGPPKRGAANLTEHRLARWLASYSTHAAQVRHPDRINELDARIPGWRRTSWKSPTSSKGQTSLKKRSYTESAQLIAAYFRENGSLPVLVPSLDGEQARLATSLQQIRTLKRQGRLPDAVSQILDEAHPGWKEGVRIGSDRHWQARADELIAWVTQHGRTPHPSAGDRTERALGGWVTRQRAHALHGQYPDRIKELNTRLPGWSRSPSSTPKPRARPARR